MSELWQILSLGIVPIITIIGIIFGLGLFVTVVGKIREHFSEDRKIRLIANRLSNGDQQLIGELRPSLMKLLEDLPWETDRNRMSTHIHKVQSQYSHKSIRGKIPGMLSYNFTDQVLEAHKMDSFLTQKQKEIEDIVSVEVQKKENTDYNRLADNLFKLQNFTQDNNIFKTLMKLRIRKLEPIIESQVSEKNRAKYLNETYFSPNNPAVFVELKGIVGTKDLRFKDKFVDVLIYCQSIDEVTMASLSLLRASHGIRVFLAIRGSLDHVPKEVPIYYLGDMKDLMEKNDFAKKWGHYGLSRPLTVIKDERDLSLLSLVDKEEGESLFTEFYNQFSLRRDVSEIKQAAYEMVSLMEEQIELLEGISDNQKQQTYSLEKLVALGRINAIQNSVQIQELKNLNHTTSVQTEKLENILTSHVFKREKLVREVSQDGKITIKRYEIT